VCTFTVRQAYEFQKWLSTFDGNFSSSHRTETGSEDHPLPYPLSLGIKRPEREPLWMVEIMNAWRFISTKPYVFMALCSKAGTASPLMRFPW
jgi:hypothetical protein